MKSILALSAAALCSAFMANPTQCATVDRASVHFSAEHGVDTSNRPHMRQYTSPIETRPALTGEAGQLRLADSSEEDNDVREETRAGSKRQYTPDQKAASDDLMRSGIKWLQDADVSLGIGDMPATANNLKHAFADMRKALPHYYGHRARALRKTKRAYSILETNQQNAVQQAHVIINRAISDAQTALTLW